MTTDTKIETPQRVGPLAPWLGTYDGVMFAAALRKMKAKLRKGWKHTIDTSDKEATEWPTYNHPVIGAGHVVEAGVGATAPEDGGEKYELERLHLMQVGVAMMARPAAQQSGHQRWGLAPLLC